MSKQFKQPISCAYEWWVHKGISGSAKLLSDAIYDERLSYYELGLYIRLIEGPFNCSSFQGGNGFSPCMLFKGCKNQSVQSFEHMMDALCALADCDYISYRKCLDSGHDISLSEYMRALYKGCSI